MWRVWCEGLLPSMNIKQKYTTSVIGYRNRTWGKKPIFTTLYSTVVHCTVLYCTLLYRTINVILSTGTSQALFCLSPSGDGIVVYCMVLYFIVQGVSFNLSPLKISKCQHVLYPCDLLIPNINFFPQFLHDTFQLSV